MLLIKLNYNILSKLLIYPLILLCSLQVLAQDTDKYAVLIAAYGESMPQSYFKDKGVENVYEKVELRTLYKYYLRESFNSKEEAVIAQQKIKEGGIFNFARVINLTELEYLCSNSCNESVPMTSILIQSQDEIIRVRNIFFGFDSDLLNREGREELEKLSTILIANSDFIVEVHAHTDAIGSNEYNLNLSERRKNRVINYIKYKGVPEFQIESYAHGEKSPIALNDTNGQDIPAGREYNRRVELKVKDKNELLDVVEDILVPEKLRRVD